jgi:hypothetical protein
LRERVGCGVAARLCGIILNGSNDCFDYAFHIVKDVRIPETQNFETLLI